MFGPLARVAGQIVARTSSLPVAERGPTLRLIIIVCGIVAVLVLGVRLVEGVAGPKVVIQHTSGDISPAINGEGNSVTSVTVNRGPGR